MRRTETVPGIFLYEETVVPAPETGTYTSALADGETVAAGETCGKLQRLNDLFLPGAVAMKAPRAGIYRSRLDGWEGILTADRLKILDLREVFARGEKEAAETSFVRRGKPCFKLFDPKKDVTLLLSVGTSEPKGKSVKLLWHGEEITATPVSRYRFGNQWFLSVSFSPRETCFEKRFVEAELILKEENGVTVAASAVKKRFGETGVYCNEKGKLRFYPVTVRCSDGTVCVVDGIFSGKCVWIDKS